MTQVIPIPPPGFDELTIDEKVNYVQRLWDRIAAHPDDVPVPDWHETILEERLAAYRANPQSGRPWQEVRDDLLGKLADAKR
jgi:putative addiction module component (TIGR02574 family)